LSCNCSSESEYDVDEDSLNIVFSVVKKSAGKKVSTLKGGNSSIIGDWRWKES